MPTIETPPCPVCDRTSKVTITPSEYDAYIVRHQVIQEAMPSRTADFREMIVTGTHPKCWDKIFPTPDLDISKHQDPAPAITRKKPPPSTRY